MRRMIALVTFTLLLLGAAAPALAQVRAPVGPGGLLYWDNATRSYANDRTTQHKLLGLLIPPSLMATQPVPNTTSIWPTSAPISVKIIGQLTTLTTVQAALGINYGSGATLSLINSAALTSANEGFSDAPFELTVYLVPLATTSATPNMANSLWMQARFATRGLTNANAGQVEYTARVLGTSVLASPTELNIYWRWLGAAVTGGSSVLRVHSTQVKIGL